MNITAKCRNQIDKTVKLFSDKDYTIDISFEENNYYMFSEKEENQYRTYHFASPVTITQKELEENFEITFESGCLNTCVRNGIPCEKLRGFTNDESHRTKKSSHWCSISWDVGRGGCSAYETTNE